MKDDNWHLRKTNMFQEATNVLNDLDMTLDDCNIKDGELLLLEEGRIPAKGFLKLPVVRLPSPPVNAEHNDGMLSWGTDSVKDDNWHLRKTNMFQEATDVLNDLDMTLDDCNIKDGELLLLEEGRIPAKGFLKLPVVLLPSPPVNAEHNAGMLLWGTDSVKEDGLPTTVLKGAQMQLQGLKVTSSSQLGVQLVSQEEELSANHMILEVAKRVTSTRTYQPARELTWNTKDGATPQSLRKAAADLLALPVEFVAVYKHLKTKHEWLVISERAGGKQGKGKGEAQKGQKTNVKNSPFFIKDGDFLGVKNLQLDPYNKDDMCTTEDEQGKAALKQLAEDKKKPEKSNMLEGLTDIKVSSRIDYPSSPRKSSRLCGIFNQGATCFLNSLVQTLVMTPELREALFDLSDDHLGTVSTEGKSGSKGRVIAIQLRRLFARLLLLNVEGVYTTDLTDSFGWNSQDCIVQHDVQELNQILFSAIEDSLVGTPGSRIINDLYRGLIINQIICEECGGKSEQEEKFLDLCVAVAGMDTLETSLHSAYIKYEHLSGDNKYPCYSCHKLVNAKKGARIRRLPPILSVSLLRFSFDYQKLERYKETRKFVFPHELDMRAYCEHDVPIEKADYELFSVVIHSGSTHDGHYHCYIRDVDSLGTWTNPEEQEIQLPVDPETRKLDYIEFDSPIELLQAILSRAPDKSMTVDKMCGEMTKQTGVTWNKRFKAQYGPINKFLRKYNDKFAFDQATNLVSVKSYTSDNTNSKNQSKADGDNESKTRSGSHYGSSPKAGDTHNNKDKTHTQSTKQSSANIPENGHCWFDYNDSRIRPIKRQEIERQYSGKESAYMLFYRLKSLTRPAEAVGNPWYKVPEQLVADVLHENDQLEKERKVNAMTLVVHLSQFYSPNRGALEPISPSCSCVQVATDRRKTVTDLHIAVKEEAGDLIPDNFFINIAKELSAGLHLYDCISEYPCKTLMEVGLSDLDNVFAWDGKEINGEVPLTGVENEPVFLNVMCTDGDKMSWGFPKSMHASGLIDIVKDRTNTSDFALCRLTNRDTAEEARPLSGDELVQSLAELRLCNGDTLICKPHQSLSNPVSNPAVKQVKLMNLIIELRCKSPKDDGSHEVIYLEADKSMKVGDVKARALSIGHVTQVHEGGRMRIDHKGLGLRFPLQDGETLENAGVKSGTRLVLEDGSAPKKTYITLYYTSANDLKHREILIDRKATVEQCLILIIQQSGMKDDNWHLRKTNMFQEATEVLNDLDMTLDDCNIKDGDLLLLEKGQIPVKGFLKLHVVPLQSPPVNVEHNAGMLSWGTDSVKAIFNSFSTGDQNTNTVILGEILISKEESLNELKLQIMTLPAVENLSVPSVNFLRVRLIEDGFPTTVLKGAQMQLQRLKVTSSSQLGVQVLSQEEELSANHMILEVAERVTSSRTYQPARELTWNTKDGATPQSLRQAAADLLALPVEFVAVYKHLKNKHEWLVISDRKGKQGKVKGKPQKGQKTNVKNSPFFIKDGDFLGVKKLQLDPYNKDDMCTTEDEQGKAALKQLAEDKNKQREQNKAQGDVIDMSRNTRNKRREEKAIKIHVDNFS